MKSISSFLLGPFVGSLNWEMYHFAPFCNFLKYSNPHYYNIVLTRLDRFDLYGTYANIMVPLRLKDDDENKQECFKLQNMSNDDYLRIKDNFFYQYQKRFVIEKHYYPNIDDHNYKVKWQFSRSNVTFDFKPRLRNKDYASIFYNIDLPTVIVDLTLYNEEMRASVVDRMIRNNYIHPIFLYDKTIFSLLTDKSISVSLKSSVQQKYHTVIREEEASIIGILMELIRPSILQIGNFKSAYTHLAMLLKKPTFSIGSNLDNDQINLLNPLKAKVYEEKSLSTLMSLVARYMNENYV